MQKIETLSVINIPLSALKCLYKSENGEDIVCEIKIAELKKLNNPQTIDEFATEAYIEYFTGNTKSFNDTKKLMDYLNT